MLRDEFLLLSENRPLPRGRFLGAGCDSVIETMTSSGFIHGCIRAAPLVAVCREHGSKNKGPSASGNQGTAEERSTIIAGTGPGLHNDKAPSRSSGKKSAGTDRGRQVWEAVFCF